MAYADYRLCDVCGKKAFYDAELNYQEGPDDYARISPDEPYRIAGKEQYDDPDLLNNHGLRLGFMGDWAVICYECSKKFKTAIVPIDTNDTPQSA